MPEETHFDFIRNRRKRIILFTSIGFLAAGGGAFAVYKTMNYPVQRDGRETRVNVIMSVPYGSLTMAAGTKANEVAQLQTQSANDENVPLQVRYNYDPVGTTGTLRMIIGSDEGMLETDKPLAQAWKANTHNALVGSGPQHYDFGDISRNNPSTFDLLSPAPLSARDESDRSKVFLTRDIPITISAQLGFGESVLDWTGLALGCAYVETGSAKAQIHIREHNKIPMSGCRINAGFGEFSMDGISDLNTDRFQFSGGVGVYKLSFNGTLSRNLDATIEVGLGKVAVNIPPEAGRVQIFYEDSYFSSFSFSGLTKRRDGCYTSVGFEQSKAPILTLRLSSGLGKMVVSYR
ncbi:MAG: hypothetical protein ABI778_10395 [Ignavibacteriota bacterium]